MEFRRVLNISATSIDKAVIRLSTWNFQARRANAGLSKAKGSASKRSCSWACHERDSQFRSGVERSSPLSASPLSRPVRGREWCLHPTEESCPYDSNLAHHHLSFCTSGCFMIHQSISFETNSAWGRNLINETVAECDHYDDHKHSEGYLASGMSAGLLSDLWLTLQSEPRWKGKGSVTMWSRMHSEPLCN